MTIPYVFSSGFSTFVPQATGQMIAAIKNPSDYPVNKYIQLVDAKKSVFTWYKLHFDDLGQRGFTSDPDNEGIWVDGFDAPENNQNLQRHTMVEAQCIRRAWDFKIGWENIAQADFKTLQSHTLMVQNQAMTNITRRAVDLLTTASNWTTANYADATTLSAGAGFWDQASSDPASPNYLAIKKTIDTAVETIRLVTNDAFKLDEKSLRLVLNPRAAKRISQTDEIHNYLKGSPDAREVLQSTLGNFGLPKTLYGVEIVVESTPKVIGHPKADGSSAAVGSTGRSYAWPENSAVLMSRMGGLDGQMGPNFSTCQRYYKDKEIAVEVKDFEWDRLTKGRAVINDVMKLTCPESGFLIQNIFS